MNEVKEEYPSSPNSKTNKIDTRIKISLIIGTSCMFLVVVVVATMHIIKNAPTKNASVTVSETSSNPSRPSSANTSSYKYEPIPGKPTDDGTQANPQKDSSSATAKPPSQASEPPPASTVIVESSKASKPKITPEIESQLFSEAMKKRTNEIVAEEGRHNKVIQDLNKEQDAIALDAVTAERTLRENARNYGGITSGYYQNGLKNIQATQDNRNAEVARKRKTEDKLYEANKKIITDAAWDEVDAIIMRDYEW